MGFKGTIRRTLLSALALAVAGCGTKEVADRTDATPGYWQGEFDFDGRAWEIGIDFDNDCADGLLIDMPAVWRAQFSPENLICNSQGIKFDLPLGLGEFSGNIDAGAFRAEVTRKDGRTSSLRLTPAQIPSVEREIFNVVDDDVHIGGTLVRPDDDKRHPAIIVVHGGGDSTRDAPPYRFWGDHLAKRGFAVYLYDKRGSGESSGSWRDVGFEARAADLVAISEALAARPDIDADKIGALAVSQGGWVAALASILSNRLAFYAAISSPLVTPLEADTFAMQNSLRRAGLDNAEIDEVMAVWDAETRLIRDLNSPTLWAEYEAVIERARTKPWWKPSSYQPLTRDSWFGPWYSKVLDFDPAPIVAESRAQSLWLFGGEDTQSDVGKNASILADLARGGALVEYQVFAGGDHGVLVGENDIGDYPAAADGFFRTLTDFLDQVVANREPPK